MAKFIGFKQIILIVLPLLLVVLGVLYYQDILAFVRPDKSLSDDAHQVSNQFIPGSNTNSESGEDQTSSSSPGSSGPNSTVQQSGSNGTGQIEELAPLEGNQITQVADALSVLLPEDRDLVNKAEDILTFLPSSLQNLRDPFQNLQKQAEMAAQNAAQLTETDKVKDGSETVTLGETKTTEQNVTYEDLLKTQQTFEQQTNTPGIPDQLEQPPVKQVIQYPPCVLKGLVSQGGRQKAILVVKEQSYIVNNGDRVQDWFVKEITQNAVLVTNQDGQCFRITLEGVTLDEEINEGTKE